MSRSWIPILALWLAIMLAGCQTGGTLSLDDDDEDDDTADDDTADDDTADDDTADDDTADDDSADDDATGDDDTTAPPEGVYIVSPIELEETLLGCESYGGGTVVNASDETVTISDVAVTEGTEVLETLFSEPLPWILEPGQTGGFGLVFTPTAVGDNEGLVAATTDHPDHPEVEAPAAGTGVADDDWMEAFTVEEVVLVDLLWVVDNSCSMEPEQETLAALGGQVVDFLTAEGVDYQLGVVTTDNAHLQGNDPIMTPWTVDVADVFAAAVQVGTAGSGTEQPLHHALAALSPPLSDPGGVNDGFLREEAGLAVIVVTDEDDQSVEPVGDLIAAFQALKPDPGLVAVNAIHPGESGCSAPDGWVGAAPRLHEAVQIAGGAEISVCEADWSAAWTGVPDLLLGPDRTFELTFTPVPQTIEIEVDGVPITDGWSYDGAHNAIVFDVGAVPEVGSELLVYYVEPAAECP